MGLFDVTIKECEAEMCGVGVGADVEAEVWGV